jgi:alpha-1,3-rhamnosyl/mannosyltransferase
MRRILRPSVLGARGVLCDSEATRKDLLSWVRIDSSMVWVVSLGARSIFRQDCSEERKAAICRKYGISKRFFLYVGNIEPRKNIPILLGAFNGSTFDEFELVLVGRRAWLWRTVVREIRRRKMQERVRLLDYVPDEDLPALYQSAHAFVYPSRMEGFGLPVLEAMASGLPVIASRVEPIQSLVGDTGWLADPDDAREWREAMEQAAQDGRQRLALAARAKERAEPYTWERTALETAHCYGEALARREGLEVSSLKPATL